MFYRIYSQESTAAVSLRINAHIPVTVSVYVGDSDVDLATAENAGIPCISVSWGFRDREFLLQNGAKRIADTMDDPGAAGG